MKIFELRPDDKNVSREELLADLVRVAGELGLKCVTMKQYDGHGKFKHKRFLTRFGSWLNALEAAGLEKTRHYAVTDAELYENMKRVWTILGRQPIFREMKKPLSKFRGRAYLYAFGTWRKSLEWFVKLANDEKAQESIRCVRERRREKIALGLRYDVLRRDRYRCRACGRSPATESRVKLHIDHIKPLAKGGKTEVRNLQTLCGDCNLGKGINS